MQEALRGQARDRAGLLPPPNDPQQLANPKLVTPVKSRYEGLGAVSRLRPGKTWPAEHEERESGFVTDTKLA